MPRRVSANPKPPRSASARPPAAFANKALLYGILLAITLGAYINSFGLGIARDGHSMVEQDQRIRSASLENVGQILRTHYWWPAPTDRLYRPVTTLSFLFNYAVLGDGTNPAGYHRLNFLLHLINVLLVFELTSLLFGRPLPALVASAIWAVHPVNTEVVANIGGRADLLAAIGTLGGLVLYARSAASAGRRRIGAMLGLFALSTLGIFSKENAAVLVGLMLLWDLSFGVKAREEILRRLPFYAAAVVSLLLFLVIRQRILSGFPVPMPAVLENPLLDLSFWQARLVALKVIGMYLWMLVYPMNLSSDRSYNQIPLTGAGDPFTWFAVVVAGALFIGAVAMYRRDRLIFWCAGFFALALLPTSNLVIRIGSIMAERFLYLPAIGFAAAIVALAFRWKPESKTAVAILSVVALLYAGRTLARNPDWNNDFALVAADLKAAPNSIRLHSLYGENLFSRDPRANLDAAIREQEAAWTTLAPLSPGKIFVVTPTALGMLYGLKGELAGGMSTAEGRSFYEKALATLTAAYEAAQVQQKEFDEQQRGNSDSPPPRIQYSPVYFYLGQAYIRLGRHSEGIRYYRQGIAREPENPAGHDTLIHALLERGDTDGAAVALHEKAAVLGTRADTIAAFSGIYHKLPDGGCAIRRTGGVDLLDTSCPRVAQDMCKALAGLEPMFAAARKPARAAEWKKAFEQRGCR